MQSVLGDFIAEARHFYLLFNNLHVWIIHFSVPSIDLYQCPFILRLKNVAIKKIQSKGHSPLGGGGKEMSPLPTVRTVLYHVNKHT